MQKKINTDRNPTTYRIPNPTKLQKWKGTEWSTLI